MDVYCSAHLGLLKSQDVNDWLLLKQTDLFINARNSRMVLGGKLNETTNQYVIKDISCQKLDS